MFLTPLLVSLVATRLLPLIAERNSRQEDSLFSGQQMFTALHFYRYFDKDLSEGPLSVGRQFRFAKDMYDSLRKYTGQPYIDLDTAETHRMFAIQKRRYDVLKGRIFEDTVSDAYIIKINEKYKSLKDTGYGRPPVRINMNTAPAGRPNREGVLEVLLFGPKRTQVA